MDGKLVIDVSHCNSITRVFEDPVGSGKYKATFEVQSAATTFYHHHYHHHQYYYQLNAPTCSYL